MKNRYKREAWYLDEDVLIYGYTDKRGFHPQKGIPCGFGLQIVNKKQKFKTWFPSLNAAFDATNVRHIAGGEAVFGVDVGLYQIKTIGSIASYKNKHGMNIDTKTFDTTLFEITNVHNPTIEEIAKIMAHYLQLNGFKSVEYLLINIGVVTSENADILHEITVSLNENKYHFIMNIRKFSNQYSPINTQ